MRSLRFVMALCVMVLVSAACDLKTTVLVGSLTGPSGVLPQCRDGVNNDPWEDDLIDARDPDCHTDGNANNPASYDPNDNSEAGGSGPTGQSGLSAPGAFQQNDGLCQGSIAKLNWTASSGVEYYQVWRQLSTNVNNGSLFLARDHIAANNTSADLQADPNATNFWKIVAVNRSGQTASTVAAGIRTDVPGFVYVCGAFPAPVTSAPPSGTTPPTGTTPPSSTTPPSTTPPSGSACSGMSWSASKYSGPVNDTFTVSINSGGCQVVLESDRPDNVSVNNQNGRFVARGSANVCLRSIAGLAPSICQTMTTQ